MTAPASTNGMTPITIHNHVHAIREGPADSIEVSDLPGLGDTRVKVPAQLILKALAFLLAIACGGGGGFWLGTRAAPTHPTGPASGQPAPVEQKHPVGVGPDTATARVSQLEGQLAAEKGRTKLESERANTAERERKEAQDQLAANQTRTRSVERELAVERAAGKQLNHHLADSPDRATVAAEHVKLTATIKVLTDQLAAAKQLTRDTKKQYDEQAAKADEAARGLAQAAADARDAVAARDAEVKRHAGTKAALREREEQTSTREATFQKWLRNRIEALYRDKDFVWNEHLRHADMAEKWAAIKPGRAQAESPATTTEELMGIYANVREVHSACEAASAKRAEQELAKLNEQNRKRDEVVVKPPLGGYVPPQPVPDYGGYRFPPSGASVPPTAGGLGSTLPPLLPALPRTSPGAGTPFNGGLPVPPTYKPFVTFPEQKTSR